MKKILSVGCYATGNLLAQDAALEPLIVNLIQDAVMTSSAGEAELLTRKSGF